MTVKNGRRAQWKAKYIRVNDFMQNGYRYKLSAPVGRNFDSEFRPELTPKQMLALGVFCGKYMTDTKAEFPKSWFSEARLSPGGRDCALNYFGIHAGQSLSEWRRKGWIHPDDPRGWFSGTAVTTWAGACRRKTDARSTAGRRLDDILPKCNGIASQAIRFAGLGNGKLYFSGLTTAAASEPAFIVMRCQQPGPTRTCLPSL